MISKFYLSSIAFICGILVIILIYLFYFPSVYLLLGIVLIVFMQQVLYIYGMFSTRSNFFFKTIKGKEYFHNRRSILFRFDDGPDPVYTPKILDILKSEGIQALFAVMGRHAELYPEIIERMHGENHIICNHTYSHPYNILLLGYKRILEEIAFTNTIIQGITGIKPKYFCPPLGHKNPVIGIAIKKLDLIPVMWDIRTVDTHVSSEKILNKIKRKLKPPSIIMFHDGILPWSRKDREYTVQALKETIRFLKGEGFEINAYNGGNR